MTQAITERKESQVPAQSMSHKLVGRIADKYGIAAPALLQTLRDTAFAVGHDEQPFSDTEMAAALILCEQYDLNPFAKEIYVIRNPKTKRLLVIVPVDGWIKILNRQKEYDGLEFEEKFTTEGEILAVTCRIFVKGRTRPIVATEYYSECYRDNSGPWKSHPSRMLRHKAIIQTARIAFGLSGLLDDDELERMGEADVLQVRALGEGGKKPGYLAAPAVREENEALAGELKRNMLREKVPVTRKVMSEEEEQTEIIGPEEPPGSDPRINPKPHPEAEREAGEELPDNPAGATKEELYDQWVVLRGQLKGDQLVKVREKAGVQYVNTSCSVADLQRVVAAAESILAGR